MIEDLIFINSEMMLSVVIVFCIGMLFFLWKDWTEFPRWKFFFKLLIGFIALGSLALIALKPATLRSWNAGSAIILTDNFEKSILDSLKNAKENIEIITYKPGESLFENEDSFSNLIILGDGIQPYDFWQIENLNINYLGAARPKGINRIKYGKNLNKGDTLVIKGEYYMPQPGHQLILEDFAGNARDSVSFTDQPIKKFLLKETVNVPGEYLYKLKEQDSIGNIIKEEVIPVIISERDPLNIIVLNNYPLFETKYLKAFLSSEGHEVLIKTRVSTGRYKYEFFNTDKRSIGKISEDGLDETDLLIMDADYLKLLNNREMDAMQMAIREKGLGFFIQANDSYFNSNDQFGGFSFKSSKASVSLKNIEDGQLEKYPYSFNNSFLLEPIQENSNEVYSAYKKMGKGRIGTSVFDDTYQLILNGQEKAYQYIWSEIVNSISKKNLKNSSFVTEDNLIYTDEPFSFKLRTNFEKPKVLTGEGVTVPLEQDFQIKDLWRGRVYSSNIGWHRLSLEQDSTEYLDYYIYENGWNSLSSYKTQLANTRFSNSDIDGYSAITNRMPINRLWLFVIFLVCMGILWLEPKL